MTDIRISRLFGVKVYTVYCDDCRALVKSTSSFHWFDKRSARMAKAEHLESNHNSRTIFRYGPPIQKSTKTKEIV